MATQTNTGTPLGRKARRSERLWLVCFQYDEPALPDEARPHGGFQIVARATTPKKALDLCRTRLRELRTTTGLFDRPRTIYFDHMLAIENVGAKPALVNYVARVPYERGIEGEILCGLPEQPDIDVEVLGPREEKGDIHPFLDFGGRQANELLARAAKKQTSPPVEPRRQPRR